MAPLLGPGCCQAEQALHKARLQRRGRGKLRAAGPVVPAVPRPWGPSRSARGPSARGAATNDELSRTANQKASPCSEKAALSIPIRRAKQPWECSLQPARLFELHFPRAARRNAARAAANRWALRRIDVIPLRDPPVDSSVLHGVESPRKCLAFTWEPCSAGGAGQCSCIKAARHRVRGPRRPTSRVPGRGVAGVAADASRHTLLLCRTLSLSVCSVCWPVA